MPFEYKTVAAPERAKRRRGAKTRTERVAMAVEDLLNEHAVDGWEYLRTDLLPVEERYGFLSRVREVHRAVMVFRRPLPGAATGVARSDRTLAAGPRAESEATALPPLPNEYDAPSPDGRTEPKLAAEPAHPDRLAR